MRERDVKAIFGDSGEVAEQLRLIAEDSFGSYSYHEYYWLQEAAVHIEGLYADACDMQRTIKRLRAELAKSKKAPNDQTTKAASRAADPA